MAAVLKTVVLKGTGGSNPSLSASEAALNALLLSLRVRDKSLSTLPSPQPLSSGEGLFVASLQIFRKARRRRGGKSEGHRPDEIPESEG